MALANNSLIGGSFKAASSVLGSYPSPITFSGYCSANSTVFTTGDVIVAASGVLAEGGENPGAGTVLGVLAPVGPQRWQDNTTAAVGSFTTRATGSPDYLSPAGDFVLTYYPGIPGQFFVCHYADSNSEGGGIDDHAEANGTFLYAALTSSVTVLAGAANAQIDYGTAAGIHVACATATAPNDWLRSVALLPWQATTWVSGAVSTTAGYLTLSSTTGTLNPQIVVTPQVGTAFNN